MTEAESLKHYLQFALRAFSPWSVRPDSSYPGNFDYQCRFCGAVLASELFGGPGWWGGGHATSCQWQEAHDAAGLELIAQNRPLCTSDVLDLRLIEDRLRAAEAPTNLEAAILIAVDVPALVARVRELEKGDD